MGYMLSGKGFAYDLGNVVAEDKLEAAAWLRKAAGQGDIPAQIYLGRMYQNGDGVPLDLSQAAEWYRKAASDGNPEAKNIWIDCSLTITRCLVIHPRRGRPRSEPRSRPPISSHSGKSATQRLASAGAIDP